MLTTYLADIEQLLDDEKWELALKDALELPHIAVALTDPGLRSSAERCRMWCAQWLSPDAQGSQAQHERIRLRLSEHLDGGREREAALETGDSVAPRSLRKLAAERIPTDALRRLRLRRYARNPPRGFRRAAADFGDPAACDTVEICTALVEGARRWYANSACHDATAQANLARLAVLR